MGLFDNWEIVEKHFYAIDTKLVENEQLSTNEAFSEKWEAFANEDAENQGILQEFQKKWFLELYGFESEKQLANYLNKFSVILDAGCGLGFKSEWFASLAPNSTIIGIDYSEASRIASRRLAGKNDNLIFAKGDIADTRLPDHSVGIVICDQVIMHTQDPTETLKEFSRIISNDGKIFCYWYRKKAMPRELLDDHFRRENHLYSYEELWQLSNEVLEFGKSLSEMKFTAKFPSIPSMGIEGGEMDLQRFIYWNFLKCFWNEKLGFAVSLSTNFDWYSPANAKRFSKEEVLEEIASAHLSSEFFHEEAACYSGRFSKILGH